jgi:hypothetical protein
VDAVAELRRIPPHQLRKGKATESGFVALPITPGCQLRNRIVTASKSCSKPSDSSPESRLEVGEKEPTLVLQNATLFKHRRKE